MNRVPQIVLVLSTLLASWVGMQAVHEAGHVLGAWCAGGSVERVVLSPWAFSRTDVGRNPHPLVVVWAGPLLGCLAPLIVWALADAARLAGAFLLRFFAGFCLIANGGYIGGGSFAGDGDCGEMLRGGSPVWTLWIFGLASLVAGLSLWHGQGPHFGLASARGRVSRSAALAAALAAAALLVLELAWGLEK